MNSASARRARSCRRRSGEEQERADRAIGVLQPRARAAQRGGDRLDRLVLADDAFVQAILHVDQLLGFALEQAADGDARPAGDDLCDVVGIDLLFEEHRRLAAAALALCDSYSAISRSSSGISP